MSYLSQLFRRFCRWFMPFYCVICENVSDQSFMLCSYCEQDLPILTNKCLQCASFFYVKGAAVKCGDCLKTPPSFDATYPLFKYQPPINQLIIQLKFYHQLVVAQLFGTLLVRRIQTEWYREKPLPDVIIPVPLHQTRLKERGFNQALEIARPIARRLHIPLDFLGTKRIKPTLPQSQLASHQRRQNIQDAFVSNRCYKGLSIAVVDDVMTTGETLRAFCRLLKDHGAKNIDIWCCARVNSVFY